MTVEPESTEDLPVRVTLRDVYTAVTKVSTEVSSMKGALDLQALASTQDHDRVVDHEARIRFLEKWAWSIPAAVLTGSLGALASILALVAR